MKKLKTETVKWGGALNNEIVGKLLLYASEIGGTQYKAILEFIQGCPTQKEIDTFLEELEAIINR